MISPPAARATSVGAAHRLLRRQCKALRLLSPDIAIAAEVVDCVAQIEHPLLGDGGPLLGIGQD
jgi:hypothetical protein